MYWIVKVSPIWSQEQPATINGFCLEEKREVISGERTNFNRQINDKYLGETEVISA